MVISLIYTPPFLAVEHARGNSNGRIVHHRLMRLAMKLVVAQFCRTKDHESMKEQIVCGQKMQCSFHMTTSYSYEPAAAQPIALLVYRWPLDSTEGGTVSSNLSLVRQSRRVLPFLLCIVKFSMYDQGGA